ncbi:hypothetical protein [Thalassospira aquimaris]|uniref:Uncharacterized protein n=1 Tax=Thalassospira aquimaris TaxID=3037796 RepID=A0ABT6GGD3_9PROT|nr:hypothetical protein [Thalassospira sp. FZY0004]MDG4721147.1 hypothetical protein [Thalassospira sp. FZY0004]
MAGLEENLVSGIRSLSPQQVAIVDRWIDSDPEAVQILVGAVPSLRPLLEPFISGDGNMGAAPAQQMSGQPSQMGANSAQMLMQIAGR